MESLAGKRVLVTGASGFLGGAMVKRLTQEGAEVLALARTPDKAVFLRHLPNVEIVQGDITDAARMISVTHGCQIVFHVAAALNGALDHQRRANVDGTANVMRAAAGAYVRRVVHVSSIAVYGMHYGGDIYEDAPRTHTRDPYALSKAEAETVVRAAGGMNALSYSIIRPGCIYGPRSGFWTRQMFLLARRNPTPFIGDGSGTAPIIYVDDVLDLMLTLATHPAADGETFNCVSDPAPTWREFLGAYSRLAKHHNWLAIPPALAMTLRPLGRLMKDEDGYILEELIPYVLHQRRYRMDKAHDLLGWQPKVDLMTGISGAADWLHEKKLL